MKGSSKQVADLVGAITANIYMLLIIAVFIARILGWLEIGRWVGFASSLVIFPLLYLSVVGLRTNRRKIYFVWLALMVLFVLFELVVDQILMIHIRSAQWTVILYVLCFNGSRTASFRKKCDTSSVSRDNKSKPGGVMTWIEIKGDA